MTTVFLFEYISFSKFSFRTGFGAGEIPVLLMRLTLAVLLDGLVLCDDNRFLSLSLVYDYWNCESSFSDWMLFRSSYTEEWCW